VPFRTTIWDMTLKYDRDFWYGTYGLIPGEIGLMPGGGDIRRRVSPFPAHLPTAPTGPMARERMEAHDGTARRIRRNVEGIGIPMPDHRATVGTKERGCVPA
jgi:hypothetical protein